ncbi:hypothetical protein L6452_28971 [Arctium lappa]|uniref:Uncharacterized protein n=1 Tax=Arctium lappa TaxID=4217 RepID=A0ACB8ZG87_ARCLA|nr:hypothetical protein L6452_28971 [Arctium lappa]
MYFVTTEYDEDEDEDEARGNLIIITRFDMKTEKWRKIAGPYIGKNIWKTCLSFMVVRGCIHLYVRCCQQRWNDDGHLIGVSDFVTELWRMDGDGDGDWTKVVDTYNSPRSFPPWFMLYPLHLMKNENWVMNEKRLKEIYVADLEMHTKKEVYSYYRNNMFITPAAKYTETFGISMFN